MSIEPGTTVLKDPSAELVYVFDWTDWLSSASISTSTFTISGPDSVLTKDNEAIVTGSKKTSVRVKAGTAGKNYTLTNRIVTNEAVPQTDERSIVVSVRHQ